MKNTRDIVRAWIDFEGFLFKIFKKEAITQGSDVKIQVGLVLIFFLKLNAVLEFQFPATRIK